MLGQKINWLRKSQIKFLVHESDRAGYLGEEMALAELRSIAKRIHGRAAVFQSLRVPKSQGNGKYEIDFLLVTQTGILVIEVKHWGGRLTRQRGQWVQERGHEKKNLMDPVQLNDEKLISLKNWLAQRGIKLPPQAWHSIVLLTNPQVSVTVEMKQSEAIAALPDLFSIASTRCGVSRRRFWQKKLEVSFDLPSLLTALEQLPTWDRLQLHGGRVVLGDLEYMAIPHVQASTLQRKYLRQAQVLLCRRFFPGLFLPAKLRVTDWSGRRKVYPLHPDSKLVFRPAGQNEKEEIAWLHVESLQLGWKDHSYYNER